MGPGEQSMGKLLIYGFPFYWQSMDHSLGATGLKIHSSFPIGFVLSYWNCPLSYWQSLSLRPCSSHFFYTFKEALVQNVSKKYFGLQKKSSHVVLYVWYPWMPSVLKSEILVVWTLSQILFHLLGTWMDFVILFYPSCISEQLLKWLSSTSSSLLFYHPVLRVKR